MLDTIISVNEFEPKSEKSPDTTFMSNTNIADRTRYDKDGTGVADMISWDM